MQHTVCIESICTIQTLSAHTVHSPETLPRHFRDTSETLQLLPLNRQVPLSTLLLEAEAEAVVPAGTGGAWLVAAPLAAARAAAVERLAVSVREG